MSKEGLESRGILAQIKGFLSLAREITRSMGYGEVILLSSS